MKFFKVQAAEEAKKDFLIQSIVAAGLATKEEIHEQSDPNWLKDKLAAGSIPKPSSQPKPLASSAPATTPKTVTQTKADKLAEENRVWRESLVKQREALLA